MLDLRAPIAAFVVAWCSGCAPKMNSVIHGQERTGDGFTLQIYDNSPTLSQALEVNASGAVIGVREIVSQDNVVYSNVCFFATREAMVDLPKLEDYTNLEVESLSDSGLAVGFASRPIGHPGGSLTAIAWDSQSKALTNLGRLPGELASHAQDISADGTRISGYSTGANPPRMRPCLWAWNADSKTWSSEALSTLDLQNPYLMSSSAIISPDGKRVAACITEAILADGTIDSSLYVWDDLDGKWERRQVSQVQLQLKAINNQGVIVGALTAPHGKMPVRIDLDGTLTKIELLPGDVSGEACGINAAGMIVGFSDDPHGPDGGPQAFIWKDGKTEALALPPETVYSAAFSINDKGQIAGMADITFPDQLLPAEQGAEPEPLVKTLGILWSPKTKSE